jgi:dipeptidyl aminopeptidase/acylaminoacyl peptidase
MKRSLGWGFVAMIVLACCLAGCTQGSNADGTPAADDQVEVANGENAVPQIASGPTATPQTLSPGGVATVSVEAGDADGDELSYTWQASGGAITAGAGTSAISWTAPQTIAGATETFDFSVTVGDGQATAAGTAQVTVSALVALPAVQRVVFQRGMQDQEQIYRIDAADTDESTLVQLTNNAGRNQVPALSADGAFVAYASNANGTDEIWIMNIDGTNKKQLTTLGGTQPNFSWDGASIVFASDRDGNYQIYSMAADGSNQQKLTNNADMAQYPAYAPGNNRIAYCRGPDYSNLQVYIMNADGSGETKLTNSPAGLGNWSPDFRSDGSVIAFESERSGSEEIWFMAPDGSNLSKTSTAFQENDPTFSVDASKIAFYYESIWIMDYDATTGAVSGVRSLTTKPAPPAEDKFPSMGP